MSNTEQADNLAMRLTAEEAAFAEVATSMQSALLLQIGDCDPVLKMTALLGAALTIIETNYPPQAWLPVLRQLLDPTIQLWIVGDAVDQAKGATKQ